MGDGAIHPEGQNPAGLDPELDRRKLPRSGTQETGGDACGYRHDAAGGEGSEEVSKDKERQKGVGEVIRKLSSGKYRLYSRKKDPKTGKRRNLGTFSTRAAAEKHERAVQFFKRRG